MQADAAKVQLFERMPVPRAVMKLAVPTVISSLVMVIYSLADTWFVGMLNDPIQNAAVTLAGPVLLAFNAIINLFGVGSSSMMSRALGARDYDTVRRSSAFGFLCSLVGGLLISVMCAVFSAPLLQLLGASEVTWAATWEYLRWTTMMGAVPSILNVVMAYLVRAEGASMHAGIGTMSGCLLNILLDPFFILPQYLNMGAAGAGMATCIANTAACCYYLVLLWCKRGKTYVCIDPRMARCGRKIVLGVCAVGVPAAIQNLLNVTGMTVLNNFTAQAGAAAVAAMGISSRINTIPFHIALGLSQGIMPLISYNYACRNVARMKKSLTFSMSIGIGFTLALSLIYYIFAGQLIGLFMQDETIVAYGTRFLRGMCIGITFLAIDFTGVGFFQACGMGGRALLFAILRKIVLEIPLLFLLNTLFPVYGLAYAQSITQIVLAAAAVWVVLGILRRLQKEKPVIAA